MLAQEARTLVVGDFVRATFSGRGVSKRCEIVAINWPTFTLKTTDAKGGEMIRTRRYTTLDCKCAANNIPTLDWPAWLSRPAALEGGDQ